MNLIDTHTHLFAEQFDEDCDEIVQKAIDSGITKLLLPNIDIATIDAMHQMVKDYPDVCYPMMGLHPSSVNENWEKDLEVVEKYLFAENHNYVAVGEMGIDLYWDKSTLEFQQKAFRIQTEWAKDLGLPIVIHVRDAFDEVFELVDELNDDKLTGIFHCFTGTKEQAEHIINYGGFKMGLGGVLTFKNSGLDQSIKDIDLKHFVLETDSPYLAPHPNRGKRNESSYITYVASKLAEVKGVSIEEVAEITTQNAVEVFNL